MSMSLLLPDTMNTTISAAPNFYAISLTKTLN
jgi:hypothetical protein